MKKSRLLFSVGFSAACFGAVALTFSGCSKNDSDKVAEAQECLDTASSSDALSCMDKVEGVESESAYLIRCSANFIYQEFTDPTRLAKIADQMKTSGASSSATAIGLLAFSKTLGAVTADTLSAQTLDYCSKASSKGMLLLASMARVASAINSVSAGGAAVVTSCDPSSPGYSAANCQTAVQSAVCSAPASTVGSAALLAYQQACAGSAQQDSSVCAQFSQAANGSTDPTVIGNNLQDQIKTGGGCP